MTEKHKHYETARRAYNWISFHTEKQAKKECAFFDEIMAEFADKPDIQAKFERLFLRALSCKSRCASSAITGGSGFNVRRAEKANKAEHNANGEMLDYLKRVRAAIKREAEGSSIISSDDADALDKLREKLAKLKAHQELMKAVNKLVRAKTVDMAALVALVGETSAAVLLKPDFLGVVRFAGFKLTNNNAKIKATEARIKDIERLKESETKETVVNGVKVVENTEENRLQLIFEGKPSPDKIAMLKRHGFKWSPRNMAWQRQLTDNARFTFKHYVMKELAA